MGKPSVGSPLRTFVMAKLSVGLPLRGSEMAKLSVGLPLREPEMGRQSFGTPLQGLEMVFLTVLTRFVPPRSAKKRPLTPKIGLGTWKRNETCHLTTAANIRSEK